MNVPFIIEKDGAEIRTLDQWFERAPPKKGILQWVDGRSAKECARAWCSGPDGPRCPSELAGLLASHPDTAGAEIRWASPEYGSRFDALPGEPRNADIVAIADHPNGRIALSVEAKADEPFDLLVRQVLESAIRKIAADQRTNVVLRVQQLASALLPPPVDGTTSLGDLRYQLLTGVAGALAFAAEVKARCAVIVIHEFVTGATQDAKHQANARDLDLFLARLTTGRARSLASGTLLGPFSVPGTPLFRDAFPLYIGKAARNLRE